MTGGMAGIAGTVFVVYATLLRPVIPDVAGHFLVASILGAPAAILISHLMVPDAQARNARPRLSDPAGRGEHHGRDRQRHRAPDSSSCSISSPC